MNKHFVFISFIVLQIFNLTGCLSKPDLPGQNPGSLHVSIEFVDGIDTALRDIQRISGNLVLKNKSINKILEEPYTGPETSLSFTDLYPGNWELTVHAVDSQGDSILSGNITVVIESGKNTSTIVALNLGQTILDISFDASQLPGLGSTITKGRIGIYFDPTSNRASYRDLSLQGTFLTATIPNLPEGDYTARICVPNATSPIFASNRFPIQFRAGKTTVIRMDAQGNITSP